MANNPLQVGDSVHAPGTAFGNGTVIAIRRDGLVVRFASGMVSGWYARELKAGHIEQHKMQKVKR